jgi:hypothetical protein
VTAANSGRTYLTKALATSATPESDMAVPKIGRPKSEKSDVLKIADDLAAKSRILRRADGDHEAVLDRLRRIGEEIASERQQRAKEIARKDVSEIEPLIEQALKYVEDAKEARREARPVLEALDAINWSVIEKKLSYEHGLTLGSQQEQETVVHSENEGDVTVTNYGSLFSTDNTKLRIARLRSALEDLRPLVNDGSDAELRARLRDAEVAVEKSYEASEYVQATEKDGSPSEWKQTWQSQYRYAVNGLRLGLSYGSVGEASRSKLTGIKRLIAEIGDDVLAGEEQN